MPMLTDRRITLALAATLVAAGVTLSGQQRTEVARAAVAAPAAVAAVPSDYVIGPEDVLGVLIWREQDLSGDFQVRSDGMISLPLLGDLQAAGYRPDQLKAEITKTAARYVTQPNVSVLVRQMNSRKVFITGEVAKPGEYVLIGPRTVMQLLALAGGLTEFADGDAITVMRVVNGQPRVFKFHYRDVARGKSISENIQLQPGDTVVVPEQ